MNRGDRQITAIVPRAALDYLRRALGDDAVDEALAGAGLHADDDVLRSAEEWLDLDAASALIDRAGQLCADPTIGRRIGEEYFLDHQRHGVTNFLLAEGDPVTAMGLSTSFASRMSTFRRFEVAASTETSALIRSYHNEASAHRRWFCDLCLGYWSNIPSLFGAAGSVVELRCEGEGHECCEFLMRWDRPAVLVAADAERSRGIADEAIARFEDFQELAADLLLAADLQAVLDVVARRVRTAVMAPQVVVTVRADDERAHVAAIGLDDVDAQVASDALWRGEAVQSDRKALVARLASPHRHYGYLAAVLPPDSDALHIDERLLQAYAGNATAAIERAVSLEEAKRSHQTAAALLSLARSLAVATSVDDVCRQITAAVPRVVGCDLGGVWLWSGESASLELRAVSDEWHMTGGRQLRLADIPSLAAFMAEPHSSSISIDEATPELASVLDGWGVRESFTAPIRLRGEFLGLVAAATTSPPESDLARAMVLERLEALADHASTALDSSMLLEQIRHQALHDGLTRLPNRSLAEARSRDALAQAAAADGSAALLFIDLDRFKNVNDTLGHAAGDQLICQVATRLERCVRATDTVARLGGDEFLVLLPHIERVADAVTVAEKIIESIREPFQIEGEPLYISSSVGIACYPEHGEDYTSLMQHADVAMYQAKAYGRSTYALGAEDISAERRSRLQLEGELHVAIARGELTVHYQPQIDLATSRIVGAEALVRWNHPTLGHLTPDAFLGIAEDSGIIVDIDRVVRRTAMAQAREWLDAGTPVRVALNLSTRDLQNPEIAVEIHDEIQTAGLPAGLVELEVTDRVVMATDALPDVMTKLSQIGVTLAIDDFGTGSSVISRLQHCPVNVLKIDRGFINELRDHDADARLVHALVSMAHALGLTVVAEGIETEGQSDILRRFGCELGQGNLYGRPEPAESFTTRIRSRR